MKNKLSTLNFKNKFKKSRKKLLEDLLDCICIINKSIILVHEKPDKYGCFVNVVATKLRILLCEGKDSLVNRLWKENKLHPLKEKYHNLEGLYLHDWDELIDKGKGTISLEKWLQQRLIYNKDCEISIYKAIKLIADKIGAHVDPNSPVELILLTNSDIKFNYLINLSKYINEQILSRIEEENS